MVMGMAAIVCSFVYTCIITVVFFAKKKVNNFETKIYGILLVLSLINMFVELHLCTNVLINLDINSLYNRFLNRIFLLSMFSWITIFTAYTFRISFGNNQKYRKIFSKKGYGYLLFGFFILVCIITVLFLPLSQYKDGTFSYSYGPATNALIIIYVVYFISWFICLVFRTNKKSYKKYSPLFVFVFLSGLALVLRQINPGILLNSLPFSFAVLLLYFTIENPDIKLINELNIAKEQAEKSNNYKTDFLSSMSHEIRTPLNAIVGFSQVLANDDNLSEEAKSEVEDIVTASETLLNIVNGILDISKIEANKIEIINSEYSTKKMLDELVALTKARMGSKPLEFKTNFDPSLPNYLYGDVSRLKQVILNLLTNSVKYTKEGFVDFKIDVILKDNICKMIISVEDSGVGIKPEDINKLFKKFERINEGNTSIEGTGLGLAITKKLVELMGGQIVVQSVYGSGSKFTVGITQKVVDKEYEEPENVDKTRIIKAIDFSSKKVLIVDDNKLNLKVAAKLISLYGINVETVESGFEFIKKYEDGNKYDLVLLDDMMPEMSGIETLKKLKERPNYSLPTVALTANAIEGMRDKYLKEGFDDYLAKPIAKNELNKIILKYLYKNQK